MNRDFSYTTEIDPGSKSLLKQIALCEDRSRASAPKKETC
jgi:hypothetical protein